MRKSILISWILLVVIFSGVLLYSTAYEIDAYQTIINFEFQISDVTIIQNQTGDIIQMRVAANIVNPSQYSSFRLNYVRGTVILNGIGSNYLSGSRWFVRTIPPRSSALVTWAYNVFIQDVDLLEDANTTGIWSWYFLIQVHLVTSIIGGGLYDRSQPFLGVKIETN